MASSGQSVTLQGVSKQFGTVTALHPVDLVVEAGEFFSVLGPSGSGKTTVLRIIAGFEKTDTGRVLLGERDVTATAPFERNVNTVFQDYALFPHMSVQQNVEYGLMVKKVDKNERATKATAMLDIVRLSGFGDRRPGQLSGGQRQRVALARALVNEPSVLLLDEPLGALDLKLREEMQVELKSIQQRVGITFIYVTHDQGEALSMSDRIAVFNEGRIQQIGSPREIYEQPASNFVAGFVGTNNIFAVDRARQLFGAGLKTTGEIVSIRPERIRVSPTAVASGIAARVVASQYLGADTRLHLAIDERTTVVSVGPSDRSMGMTVGASVWLTVEP
jgi:putative spermidine/putrescine transport system ATP-binding protein